MRLRASLHTVLSLNSVLALNTVLTLKIALAAFALLWAGRVAAAALPESVRIAAITSYVDGKPMASGMPNVVVSQGWLEAELKKRGVRLEWVPVSGANVGPLINEAFAAHRVDFAAYGDLPGIILNAAGVSTHVVVPSGRGSDTFLLVSANSTVKSIRDLKGKRIAVHRGRPWELPFVKLIDANGLSYSDFKIYNANPQTGAAALAAGAVDAIFVPGGYQLEDKGIGKILWSSKGAPLEWKYRAELWGSDEFLKQYPELAQIVATAYVKAAYWISQEQNRDEVIRRATLAGTPESVVRREYDDATLAWKERWSPLADSYLINHYRDTVQFALDKKLIRQSVDVDNLIDTRFLDAALKALNLEHYWSARSGAGARLSSR